MLLLPLGAFSQKITKDYTDEFTGIHERQTNWEGIGTNNKWTAHVSFLEAEKEILYMDIRIIIESLRNNYYSISKGDKMMIKLSNDSVISLTSTADFSCCKGCGAVNFFGSGANGISARYQVLDDETDALKKYAVVKIRLYTSKGHLELDLKEKKQEVIKSLINLF